MFFDNEQARLILASASPRRRELLTAAGYVFDVVPSPMDEPTGRWRLLSPQQVAQSLAYFKARSVWERYPRAWVMGADTVVAVGGQIIGKPSDRQHARQILSSLAGTRHSVITGVSLLGPSAIRLIAADTTHVTMRKASAAEIEAYLDSGEWQGKAGAYAIQETGDRFVKSIEGSFTNVVGLPMETVERLLAQAAELAKSR